MEESEKRRERLRAMRMEAAQVDAAGNGDEPALPSYLSNPLIESSATTLGQAEARFDFYTDPMAAFSSNKRKSNYMPPSYSGSPTSQILSNCAESTPPAPQFQRDHLQGPSHSCSSAPYGSLVRTARPFPMNQTTPMAGQSYQPHPAPSPGSGWKGSAMHGWAPQLGHSTSPQSNPSTNLGLGRGNWSGSHTSLRAELDRGTTFAWAPRPNHSPSPSSGHPRPGRGRGRGNWSGTHTSPCSGQWVSSHGRGSGIGKSWRGEGFYDGSMLEDPWKFLEPVLWKNVNHRDLKLKSPATKRPRALESWSQSRSQSSLAEYLAASFKDAGEGEPSS